MKRILGIAVVLSLVGALTVLAQEVKPGKVEVIDLGKDVKLEMVLIPAGKFKMGFTKKELEDIKVAFHPDSACLKTNVIYPCVNHFSPHGFNSFR